MFYTRVIINKICVAMVSEYVLTGWPEVSFTRAACEHVKKPQDGPQLDGSNFSLLIILNLIYKTLLYLLVDVGSVDNC